MARAIGRYGASQLSDVVVAADGTLSLITALMLWGILHPTEGLDIYGYAGFERADSNLFLTNNLVLSGFGNPIVNNSGCAIVTAASFTGGISNCTAVNKEVDLVTAGLWQNLYKGSYGRVAAGAQWEFIERKAFRHCSRELRRGVYKR